LWASRSRIVEQGDAERRRLERDLHDGAQQRLVSLALSLRLARLGGGTGTDMMELEEAEGEVRQGLAGPRGVAGRRRAGRCRTGPPPHGRGAPCHRSAGSRRWRPPPTSWSPRR